MKLKLPLRSSNCKWPKLMCPCVYLILKKFLWWKLIATLLSHDRHALAFFSKKLMKRPSLASTYMTKIHHWNWPRESKGVDASSYSKLDSINDITYKLGKSNTVANALSRQEELEASLNSLFDLENLIIVAIKSSNSKLDELKQWHS